VKGSFVKVIFFSRLTTNLIITILNKILTEKKRLTDITRTRSAAKRKHLLVIQATIRVYFYKALVINTLSAKT